MSADLWPFPVPAQPFRPERSLLAGVPNATLQQWLLQAQTALMLLSTGGKVVDVSYEQGNGKKEVRYQQADISAISAFIMLLQSQLGIVRRARRPIPFFYT